MEFRDAEPPGSCICCPNRQEEQLWVGGMKLFHRKVALRASPWGGAGGKQKEEFPCGSGWAFCLHEPEKKIILKINPNPCRAAWCYPGVISTSPRTGNEFFVSKSWMAPSDHQIIPQKVCSGTVTSRADEIQLCPPQDQYIPG